MIVSVETPVFKGGWLKRCIDSVLYQSSPNWKLSLLWDGGDEQSRQILEEVDRLGHPNVNVYFEPNRGIARARHTLSERSEGDFILPLDDDDALPFHAVERFLEVAQTRPWASVIRAQRKFIDESGRVLDTPAWFPFEPRHYQHGMVTDLFNHSQPYLIRRSAYDRTQGWEGFEDFRYAGEDCDIYLKLEEQGSIELLDDVLYYYRINSDRASLVLTDDAAFEMWRRLADKTIERIGLDLRRTNDQVPYHYERTRRLEPAFGNTDFVIVAGANDAPIRSERIASTLRNAGAERSAIRRVSHAGSAHLGAATANGSRPFTCLIDARLSVPNARDFSALFEAMTELDADLASPKLVSEDGFIVCADPSFTVEQRPEHGNGTWDDGRQDRRTRADWLPETLVVFRSEVVRAVGGFDAEFVHDRASMIDFCLRARQRDFHCAYAGDVEIVSRGPDPNRDLESDIERIRVKWAAYPQLFRRD